MKFKKNDEVIVRKDSGTPFKGEAGKVTKASSVLVTVEFPDGIDYDFLPKELDKKD